MNVNAAEAENQEAELRRPAMRDRSPTEGWKVPAFRKASVRIFRKKPALSMPSSGDMLGPNVGVALASAGEFPPDRSEWRTEFDHASKQIITEFRSASVDVRTNIETSTFIGQQVEPTVQHVQVEVEPPIQFLTKLLEVWGLSDSDAAGLLGLEDARAARDLLQARAPLRGRDAKDRIRFLLDIRETLHRLFRDHTVEREWLREKRAELQDRSPLELMLEGSIENLLRIRQFTDWVAGR